MGDVQGECGKGDVLDWTCVTYKGDTGDVYALACKRNMIWVTYKRVRND